MIFKNEEQYINYLIKMKNKKLPSEKEMCEEFIKSFNKEARKQNCDWFAEIHGQPNYLLLHISKYIYKGWWIFKTEKKVSLFISCYESPYFSFVSNDYVLSEYEQKRSDNFFYLLPEFKQVLEKIPEKICILPKGEEKNFEIRFKKIKEEIEELKNEK